MASVLIMSIHGDGVPLALRMADDGHIVKLCIKDKEAKRSLTGYQNPSLVEKPTMLDQYDLILFDMVGLGEQADNFRERGRLVYGGSLNDSLELRRDYAEKVVGKLTSITVPEGPKITDLREAMKYIKNADHPLVVKPLGNEKPSLTLVSDDPANRTILTAFARFGASMLPCIFQKRVDGIEISTLRS